MYSPPCFCFAAADGACFLIRQSHPSHGVFDPHEIRGISIPRAPKVYDAQWMTDFDSIRRHLDAERRTLAPDGWSIEILPSVTRIRSADGSHNSIVFSSLSESTADAVIAEQVAHYRKLDGDVEWKLYAHDTPPDLLQRLQRHGFIIGLREAVLVLDLHTRPSWMDEASASQVVSIQTAEQVDQFRRAAEEIFDKKYDFTAGELLAAIRSESTQHFGYMLLDGNKALSVGRLYTHPKSVFGDSVAVGLSRSIVAADITGPWLPPGARCGKAGGAIPDRGRSSDEPADLGAAWLRTSDRHLALRSAAIN